MKKHITGVLYVFVIMYFVASFIAGDLDPGMWGFLGRFCYVFMSAIFSIFVIGFGELEI